MMTSPRALRGTTEWFKRERLHLIEHGKAVDSFGAAARSFQKLIELGGNADDQVRSALHTAGVVEYARPFTGNKTGGTGSKVQFSKRVIKGHPHYSDEIHRQLIALRDKLIAHSDRDYADGRLFRKFIALDITSEAQTEQCEIFVGVSLVTQTVHTLDDAALAQRYLAHVLAAEAAAHGSPIKRLEEFAIAAREFPDQIDAARPPEARRFSVGERVQLAAGEQNLRMPNHFLNPHAVLDKPPLELGLDGYSNRGFCGRVDMSADVVRREDDGTESLAFKLEVIGPNNTPDEPSSSARRRPQGDYPAALARCGQLRLASMLAESQRRAAANGALFRCLACWPGCPAALSQARAQARRESRAARFGVRCLGFRRASTKSISARLVQPAGWCVSTAAVPAPLRASAEPRRQPPIHIPAVGALY